MRKILFLILSATLVGVFFPGCNADVETAGIIADPLEIETGYISGTMIGEPGNEVRIYRGIPYAAAPVGDRRWKPPEAADSWDSIRECTAFSNIAPQAGSMNMDRSLTQSEDCLYLNVLTPAKKTADRLPVMVWMHGGAYSAGSGNSNLFNGYRLPQQGIVQVNVNMRLNAIGLLAHPLLTEESPNNSSGNYMFLDMIAALQWVQRNIAAFGGDPDNVTIFGESGGGSKVSTLMASPLAKGLFHRVICESGSSVGGFLNGRPLKQLEAVGEKVFAGLGVDNEADPLKAARAVPFEKILEAREAVLKTLPQDLAEGGFDNSAVDGWFLPDTPLKIFQEGKHNAVPLITMANLGELTGPGGLLLPMLIPAYGNMLLAQAEVGVPGYAAIFDQVPSKWRKNGAVSTHAMELLYVFGDYDNTTGWWSFMHGLAAQSGAKDPDDPGLTEADRRISETMMKMWARFAETGDPDLEGVVEWPLYNPASDEYMYFADPLEIKTGFSKTVPETPPAKKRNPGR
jgi:para-nitrobenzyl esterase